MMDSFNKGKPEDLIKKTHPAIFKLAGGEKRFKEAIRSAAKKMIETGVKIESSEVEAPKKFHKAGDELVCFVPKTSVMVMGGQRVKSTSFMIAARRDKQDWKYMDGAGLRRNRELLWTFFPGLDKDLKLPENTIELLEAKPEKDSGDESATEKDSKSKSKAKKK